MAVLALGSTAGAQTGLDDDVTLVYRADAEIDEQYELYLHPTTPPPLAPAISQGLVAWYPFDGSTNDASGNGHHAVASGGVMTAPDRFGNPAAAVAFDGVDGLLTVPDHSQLRLTSEVTMSAWVRRSRLDSIDFLLEKGGDWNIGETNYGLSLHQPTFGHMLYALHQGGWHGADGPTDLGWHHYAAVLADGTTSLFIDGSEVVSNRSDGTPTVVLNPSTRDLHIGAQIEVGATHYSANVLDDVRIYDRALLVEEIRTLALDVIFADGFESGSPSQWSVP